MDDILTYVIIVLFFIFLLYFIYTVVDVFFLSKRNRKVKSPISHVKKEDGDEDKSTEPSSENDRVDLRKPFDEDSNKTEIVEDSDDEKSEEPKDKEDDNSEDNIPSERKEEYSIDLEKKSAKEVVNKQSKPKPKRKFSLFGFMNKGKKKPVFEREKIDEKYHELIVDFVDKNINGWNQTEFHELVGMLIKKGYDRRPSEVLEDLEIVKKEMIEERRIKAESNLSLNYSDTSDESENLSTSDDTDDANSASEAKDDTLDESSEKESAEKDLEEAKKEKESQDKLKELAKKNKESVDTRSELDKTLEEIRAIRKRLSEK